MIVTTMDKMTDGREKAVANAPVATAPEMDVAQFTSVLETSLNAAFTHSIKFSGSA